MSGLDDHDFILPRPKMYDLDLMKHTLNILCRPKYIDKLASILIKNNDKTYI